MAISKISDSNAVPGGIAEYQKKQTEKISAENKKQNTGDKILEENKGKKIDSMA